MSTPQILRREHFSSESVSEYSLSPDAAVVLMADGSARIVDMGDRFYSIPTIAAQFLQETLQHGPTAAIKRVAVEYNVAKSQAEADLSHFLATLVERGILWRREQTSTTRKRRDRAAWLLAKILGRSVAGLPTPTARAAVLLTAVKFSLKLFGWPRTVEAWRHEFPVRQAERSPHEAEVLARTIDEAVCAAASWNPFGVACKERALTCWALARMAGLSAELVVGIELYPLSGHCWCESGPWVLSDHADNCAAYLPTLRYA